MIKTVHAAAAQIRRQCGWHILDARFKANPVKP